MLLTISIGFISCDRNHQSISARKFIDSVSSELRIKPGKVASVSVPIPEGLNVALIVSSPYAIVDIRTSLNFIINSEIREEVSELTKNSSSYNLLLFTSEGIVAREKWDSPPVSFNGSFFAVLENEKSIIFLVEDNILKGVVTEH